MDFGAETCGLPPDFRPLRKAARAAALCDRRKQPLQLRKRVYCVHYMRGRRSGAYAPPLPNFQTGLILLIVVVAIVVAALLVRPNLLTASRKHDPIEYYRGWGGYRHPIGLQNKITKEEADAMAASGAVYLIGYFDSDGRLTRVVKFLRGKVFFEYLYSYHPNERLRSAKVARGGRDSRP